MTPPRRPKGEKPATTIRFLRRTMVTMGQTINLLRIACDDKDKVIAGYDVQLSEAQDEASEVRGWLAERSIQLGQLRAKSEESAKRLAFLEGYYAKSQETAPPRPIYATRASIFGDQADTDARERPRDQENLSDRRQDTEGQRQKAAVGLGEGSGETVRREPAHDQTRPRRDKVEYVEINDHNPYRRRSVDWMDH